MSGLLLLAVLALWLFVLARVTEFTVRGFPNRPWRHIVKGIIFVLLLPLPLIDEIVGGWQFARLCKEHDTIQIDRERARGKIVYFAEDPAIEIENTWTPVRQQPWRFLDATTNAPVLSYEKFTAEGGILIRTLKISEGNAPFTFAGYCLPGGRVNYTQLFEELGIKLIERKDLFKGERK